MAKQETAGTTYYAYDTENLLTRIDFADDSHNYYTYDADSKRVSQQTADGFREFIYQGPDMLKLQMERDESETTVAQYTMGDGLEAMRRSGTSSFYHYNHLGTTLALTGANEAVTDTYQHDAWGVLLGSTGATVNPHTYVGQQRYYRMPIADMYHLGFRDYAQSRGRFTTVDPKRAGMNWFRYVTNRPIVLIDPWGLRSSKQHCDTLRRQLDTSAAIAAKESNKQNCHELNDQLYIYLHDCRDFSLSCSSASSFPPPAPPRRKQFEDIPAYRVWLDKCHCGSGSAPGTQPAPRTQPRPATPRPMPIQPPMPTPIPSPTPERSIPRHPSEVKRNDPGLGEHCSEYVKHPGVLNCILCGYEVGNELPPGATDLNSGFIIGWWYACLKLHL